MTPITKIINLIKEQSIEEYGVFAIIVLTIITVIFHLISKLILDNDMNETIRYYL